MPSLNLGLDLTGTQVELRAGPEFHQDLAQLCGRFTTGTIRSGGAAQVDLDDFLRNLRALASWPSADVAWHVSLRQLVESSLRDAEAARGRLTEPDRSAEPDEEGLLARLGPSWQAPMTAFQVRDLAKLLSLSHGANFSVPGAGKTRVALAVYAAQRQLGEVARALVVAPKSAFPAWLEEAEEAFAPTPTIAVFVGQITPGTEILVVNYERLPGAAPQLAAWIRGTPSMLILDEAHRMKRGQSGAYGSACLALGPHARRRLILTGTPVPNGIEDLKSLMSFVWPGQGRQVVAQAVAGGDLRAASVALRPFFTRTTKDELGLPPLRTHQRLLQMPPLHAELYRALQGYASLGARRAGADLQALGRIVMYLLMAADSPALLSLGTTRYEPLSYQVPPLEAPPGTPLAELLRDLPAYELSPKYREVIAIVSANAEAGRKTLVWSTFVRSLRTLERMLSGFGPALVYGGTEDREAEIRRFRDDPDCLVLLSNPATLGEGISLHHSCHDAVFVDRDFAAGRYLQSLDRIHRLGLAPETETSVTVLVSAATIDEIVEQRLADKLRFMGAVLDDPSVEVLGDLDEEPSTGGGLAPSDLAGLMRHLLGERAAA